MSESTALDQLGTDLGRDPGTTHAEDVITRSVVPLHADRGSFENDKDFFIERDGVRFAGTHLIIDLWGCQGIDDIACRNGSVQDLARRGDGPADANRGGP